MNIYIIGRTTKDVHVFEKFEDVEPSIRFSYHKCVIESLTQKGGRNGCTFTVKGVRPGVDGVKADESFEEEVVVETFPVWGSPCHI